MKLLFYPCSQNDQNTHESEMAKIPFLNQNPLIPTKIHTKANNYIQIHINTHKNQLK